MAKKTLTKKTLKKVPQDRSRPAGRLKKAELSKKSDNQSVAGQSFQHLQLDQNIWPIERDVLFRPDRLKYVRRLIPNKGCVFCTAKQQGASEESLVVGVTEHSMVVLNKFPYNSGHVLVLPKKHVADPSELTELEYLDLAMTKRTMLQLLKKVYSPGGFNLGLNLGATAGAGIPGHLHYHIIPRWSGDLNFFPLIAETKVVVESLEESYSQLSRAWPDFFKARMG